MSFNVCKVKNIDSVSHTYCGQEITAGGTYTIQDSERVAWFNCDDLLSDITADKAEIWNDSAAIDAYSDQINWLKNYDAHPKDSDGADLSRVKITKTGWGLQCHAVQIETSKLSSVYDKKKDGTNYGFGTLKFYDSSDNELTTQGSIDTSCVRTDLLWEPTHDIEMIGGELWQDSAPSNDVYMWFFHEYSGHEFCSGGLNAKYLGANGCKTMDGRAPKLLPYHATYHTGRVVFRCRHNAGDQHKLMLVLEFYKA